MGSPLSFAASPFCVVLKRGSYLIKDCAAGALPPSLREVAKIFDFRRRECRFVREGTLSVTAYAVPALPEGEPRPAFRIRLTFPKKETHHCRAVGDARPYGKKGPLFYYLK